MSSLIPAAPILGNEEGSSLRDIYSILFRHKWRSLLFFLVIVGMVALGTFNASEIFESEAKVLLKASQESVIVEPTLRAGEVIDIRRTAEEQLRSELAILSSRLLAEQVVDVIGEKRLLPGYDESGGGLLEAIGLAQKLTLRQQAVRTVMENLRIDALRNTNILYVTFQCKNPVVARDTLAAVLSGYLVRHMEVYQRGAVVVFFERQAQNLLAELEEAETELGAFKSKERIADLKEQRGRFIARLSDLESHAADVAARLDASTATVAHLEDALAKIPPTLLVQEMTGVEYRYMDEARLKLFELKLEEKELLGQYPETNRLVKAVRERIRQAEQDLEGEPTTRTEVTTGTNVAYQDLQVIVANQKAEFLGLREEKKTVDEQLRHLRVQLTKLNDAEVELMGLERRRDIAEKNYRTYAERLEDARSSHALEMEKMSNVTIVQPATMPMAPVKPRKGLNLIVGIVLGFLGGIGLAFLSEHLDHSFHRPDQVEKRLGVPVLASIPKTKKVLSLRG